MSCCVSGDTTPKEGAMLKFLQSLWNLSNQSISQSLAKSPKSVVELLLLGSYPSKYFPLSFCDQNLLEFGMQLYDQLIVHAYRLLILWLNVQVMPWKESSVEYPFTLKPSRKTLPLVLAQESCGWTMSLILLIDLCINMGLPSMSLWSSLHLDLLYFSWVP